MTFRHLVFIIALLLAVRSLHAQNKPDTVVANQHLAIGDSLNQLAKYNMAAMSFKKASKIYLKLGLWAEYAASLNKSSECYWRMNDIQAAVLSVSNAIQICEKYLPNDHLQWANSYTNRGIVRFFSGQIDEAKSDLIKALNLRKKTPTQDDTGLAFTLNSLGTLYRVSNDFDIAMDYYEKALALKKSIYGLNHQKVVKTIVDMGAIQMQTTNFEEAIESLLLALTIYKKVLGPSHPDLIPVYRNLGYAYMWSSDYEKGKDYFIQAIEITANSLGKNHQLMADNYNGMAIIFSEQKEYKMALEYYFKAIEIYEKLPLSFRQNIAVIESNIGITYLSFHDYQNARIHLEKALSFQKEFNADDKAALALIYDVLGDIFKGVEEYSKALDYYTKSLSIRSEIFGDSNMRLATTYYSIATLLAIQEKHLESLKYSQKSLVINGINFSDTTIYANPPLNDIQDYELLLLVMQVKSETLVALYHKSGILSDLEAALSAYQYCDQLILQMRRSHQRYEDKVKLGESITRIYAGAVEVSNELAKIKDDNKYRGLAFYFAENSRAGILLANFSINHAKKFSGLPDDLIHQEQSLRSSQSYYQSLLVNMRASQQGYDTIKFKRYNSKLIDVNFQLDSLAVIFERNHEKYFQFKYKNLTISKKEIQERLASNQAFIEYFESDDVMYIFAITNEKFWIESFKKDSTFNESMKQYTGSFDGDIVRQDFSDHFPQFAKASNMLYEKLMEPVLSELSKRIDHLIIVPTDKLSYVPWGLLVQEGIETSRIKDYKSLNYLLNDHSISYAHSASLLFQDIYTKTKAKKSMLAYAPTYEEKTESNYMNLRTQFRDELTPLKWNTTEVNEIGQLFNGIYKSGSEATEKSFKENASEHNILHLAMHAFVDDDDPMLSKLVFFQNNDSIEDGMLHTYELFNMELAAEMVVLSACKTGLGKIHEGEGIMSLGRAFSYAGCPSLVTSHWSVDDESTSRLMTSFYKHIANGLSKDKALRLAKLDFLKQTNGPKTHPYYWGSFVVMGDTAPVSSDKNPYFAYVLLSIGLSVVVYFMYRKRLSVG